MKVEKREVTVKPEAIEIRQCSKCKQPRKVARAAETLLGQQIEVVLEECECGKTLAVFWNGKEVYWVRKLPVEGR